MKFDKPIGIFFLLTTYFSLFTKYQEFEITGSIPRMRFAGKDFLAVESELDFFVAERVIFT